jgi:hypothetical protein
VRLVLVKVKHECDEGAKMEALDFFEVRLA